MSLLVYPLIALIINYSVWFLYAQVVRLNRLADMAWAGGFMTIAWVGLVISPTPSIPLMVSTILISLWGIRLAGYLIFRSWGKGDDPRYAQILARWSRHPVLGSFIMVFLLQAVLLAIIATPIWWMITHPANNQQVCIVIGGVISLVGLLIETIADLQRYRFSQDPAHSQRLLMTGLWGYSRHPNYLGESLFWWGIYVIACDTQYGWVSIIGPLMITYLIRYVSGVNLAEQSMQHSPDYAQYIQNTPIFLPWGKPRP